MDRKITSIETLISSVDWISSEKPKKASALNVFPTGKFSLRKNRNLLLGFYHLGERATFWTSVESSDENGWGRTVIYDSSTLSRYNKYKKENGYSCRCVDN